MSHRIRRPGWSVALLSAMVTLALTGNTMAAFFCPHMSGGHCCIKSVDPQRRDSAGMNLNHMHHAEMSEMDMSDDAMDMSGGPPDDSASPVELQISNLNSLTGAGAKDN